MKLASFPKVVCTPLRLEAGWPRKKNVSSSMLNENDQCRGKT